MSLFFKRHSSSAQDESSSEPFGVLLSICYESSGGSMAFRSEFEIELTPTEIVCCAYWPQDSAQDMARKTHIPVKPEEWADVAQTVQTLWPMFQKVNAQSQLPEPEIRVLDGGDYSRWFLTRQLPDGEQTAQYYQPDDRRIRTLIALLRELADPIGREIPRYDPPVLCGVWLQDSNEHCSYQCTSLSDGDGRYRLIAYDAPKGEKRSVDLRVGDDVWNDVHGFLDPLQLDRLPSATNRDTRTCTLYFSDDKQKRVVPEKKTAQTMQSFFVRLIDQAQKNICDKEEQ